MIPELGLIEGFFGAPWSWSDRAEAVRFLAGEYDFYLYAPKADASLRRRWDRPLPARTAEELAEFAAVCRMAGMRLGVGLTPFELHLRPESDWKAPLADKIASLDAAGIDDLALLFDDMKGDVPDLAERQADIVHFAAARTGASRIICCPTYYSSDPILDSAFGQRPLDYLEDLGRLLDPAIEMMWTGEEVVSRDFSPGHLARVAAAMRRKPFLWDNYPVNDGPVMSNHLHLRGFTGRPSAIAAQLSAHGINLASQPVLSRIPALTLVESYALADDYAYGEAFERAAQRVAGCELGARLRADLIAFQDRGLDRLGERREKLAAIYRGYDHPAAREVVDWLEGRWATTSEEIQTQ